MSPDSDWSQRYPGWALVTGASSGIGAELARGLARRKLPVILVARREGRLRALAEELARDHKVDTHVVVLDLLRRDFLDELVAGVGDRPVSVLVNNAGFGLAEPFVVQSPAAVREMVELNCVVPVVTSRHFVEAMVARRNGAILTVASVAGHIVCPYFSVYSATKAFDRYFGEALHGELRHFGVDSLSLSPGVTATEFQARSGTQGPRGADPRDVAEVALRALGRRPDVIPGLKNKLLAFVVRRLVPQRFAVRLAARVGRTWVKPESLTDTK